MSRMLDILGHIQFWLQGHPNKRRPWIVVTLGNKIADYRFRCWESQRGDDA